MEWRTCGQLSILIILAALLVIMVHSAITDKRREDTIKRKEAGIWLGN
jgi:hypothetical protein